MMGSLRGSIVGFLFLGALFAALPSGYAKSVYEPVTDPAGDVTPFGLQSPVPATPLPVTAPFDLTEFGILDEDELGLKFYFTVASFKGDVQPVELSSTGYRISAKLEGTKFRYELTWFADLPGPTDNPTGVQPADETGWLQFCIREESDQGFFGCNYQEIEGTVDWDKARFEAYVTKDALMGRAPSEDFGAVGGQLPLVTKDSRLSEIHVRVDRTFPAPMSDRLPNGNAFAPSYIFQSAAANSRIRLSLGSNFEELENVTGGTEPREGQPVPDMGSSGSTANEVSVTPGIPTFVPIRVENLNAAKRLISLTATVEGGGNKWSVSIAPGLRVPANEARTVNLIVNATSALPHRETVKATVRAVSLGVADEIGAIRLTLVASVPPSPEKSTLYLHATGPAENSPNDVLCSLIIFCFDEGGWLNTLETDPRATSDAGYDMSIDSFGGTQEGFSYGQDYVLDTPLATAVVFDATRPVEAKLAFKSTVAFDAEVSIDLIALGSRRVVGSGTSAGMIGSGTPITVSFLALQDALRVEPQDGPLAIHVGVQPTIASPGAAAVLPTFQMVPGESELVLPLLPDPNAGKILLPNGASFLTLSAQTDSEEFLNPGRAKIFNATIINEGIEADDARIEVLYDDPDWRVELFPSARFRLPPGDGAKFALLVHAPVDAKEGDVVHIIVNATTGADARVQSQLRFTAIVTQGIDIPDESSYYSTDEDTEGKVIRPQGQDTPGAGLTLVLLGALLGLVVLRRRRQE